MLGSKGTKREWGKFIADDAQVKKIFMMVTIPSADLATPERNGAYSSCTELGKEG